MLGGVKKKEKKKKMRLRDENISFFFSAPTLRVKYEFLICIIAFITAACKNCYVIIRDPSFVHFGQNNCNATKKASVSA